MTNIIFRGQRKTFYTLQIPPYGDFLPILEKDKTSKQLMEFCVVGNQHIFQFLLSVNPKAVMVSKLNLLNINTNGNNNDNKDSLFDKIERRLNFTDRKISV